MLESIWNNISDFHAFSSEFRSLTLALARNNRGVKKLGESENDIGQQRMIVRALDTSAVYHIVYQNVTLEICNRLVP